MRNVTIVSMPDWVRKTRFRPTHPPIFDGYVPTPIEVEVALAMFHELDADAQAWYGGARFVERLRRLAAAEAGGSTGEPDKATESLPERHEAGGRSEQRHLAPRSPSDRTGAGFSSLKQPPL